MQPDWFDRLDAWVIVLVLLGVMLLGSEVGYRAGMNRHPHTGETGRGHFTAVQAALLGLLALLLGFTFHMATLRYETRRQLVMEDANVISALDVHSDFLTEPRRTGFKKLLQEYTGVRANASVFRPGVTDAELMERIARARDLHRQMCTLVREEIQNGHPTMVIQHMVALLSDALAVQQRRIDAYKTRVPDTVLGLLFGAAVTSACAVGYSGGLGKHRGILGAVMLSLLVCCTIYVTIDLDQPNRGIIQVDQSPILRVKQHMDSEIETRP